MADVLKGCPPKAHPDLLVSYSTADDAGVFRIGEHLALVQTVDFFPPIVDDPYQFGQIAAANALSDIYAMGGQPLTALNIVCFPKGSMGPEILRAILQGGGDKIEEAGAVVVGGHSINDKELKYGVAATGLVNPNRIVTNAKARAGDRLYLTKPLGTGLITTGIKRNKVGPDLKLIVAEQMAQLNRVASEIMVEHGAHAATDITGFGLLGHAYEMAAASGVSIRLASKQLPLMPQALELAEADMIPGGAHANREFLTNRVLVSHEVTTNLDRVLYDPQTSGGLLIAIPADRVAGFEATFQKREASAWAVGDVIAMAEYPVIVE